MSAVSNEELAVKIDQLRTILLARMEGAIAPEADVRGYLAMIEQLESWLAEVTGYDAVSLQPNAGSQGELAGLMAIRGYHRANGDLERTVCLIPSSAHGTNAASAVLAGMKVVVVGASSGLGRHFMGICRIDDKGPAGVCKDDH